MPSEDNQSFFSGAQNPNIHGGAFTNVHNGNVIINSTERSGLKLLLNNIALGAFHNAAEGGDPPKCHPRTRVAIRREIMQWIKDPGVRKTFIAWMYGPAGSGKTAIAQSIAEACVEEGLLAASFFFGRLATDRNTSSCFVATIAYQLSKSIPEMEEGLLTAIENDQTIFARSLETQMRVLVIEPLKSVQSASHPWLVVTDGVDECGPDDKAHKELLKVLGEAMDQLRNIPIMFLISSRPEYEIRTAFNKNPLSSLTKLLVLDDGYKPDKDIKIYFESIFREIQQDHLPLLRERWPAESDVNLLVSKASGQFIFASTVIRFIDSPRHPPADRLKIILGLASAGNETPFALLDALYHFILDSVADVQKVLEILTLLLLEDGNAFRVRNPSNSSQRSRGTGSAIVDPLSMAEELLGFNIRMALVDMHALLFVPLPTSSLSLRMYHASLYDFLRDQSRSLVYHIDKAKGHAYLSRHWLNIIGNCSQSRFDTQTSVDRFTTHCRHLKPLANEELVNDLAHFDLRASLEGISDFEEDLYSPAWSGFMECAKQQGGSRDDIFPRLQNEFDTFVLDCIDRCPEFFRPYVPVLLSQGHGGSDMYNILLRGARTSIWIHFRKRMIVDLFGDRTRAGKYFVDGGSYVALVKAIVNVIGTKPGERNQFIFKKIGRRDNRDQTMTQIGLVDPDFEWFRIMLRDKVPLDVDLANILCERALQFRDDTELIEGWMSIARVSLRYIERCGVPFLVHVHQPHTNHCSICKGRKGAIVVENMDNSVSAPQSKRTREDTLASPTTSRLEGSNTAKRRRI